MRKERLKAVFYFLILSAFLLLALSVYFLNDASKRNISLIFFLVNLVFCFVVYAAYNKRKSHEKALAWKPMLNRDVLANLALDLKVMRFRISRLLVEENGDIYRQFYQDYPESRPVHEQDCRLHKKEIDRLIDHAAQTYNMNVADVRAYLRNFCYLDAYFKSEH